MNGQSFSFRLNTSLTNTAVKVACHVVCHILSQPGTTRFTASFPLDKDYSISPFSQQHIKVAKLVCEDLDNARIADKLHIAYNTVRAHLVGNIFRKVGVKGKASATLEFDEVLRKARTG